MAGSQDLGELVWKAFDDARKSTVQTQKAKASTKPLPARPHADRESNNIPPPPTSSPVSDNDGSFWKQQDSDPTDPTTEISMRFQAVNVVGNIGMRPVSTADGNSSSVSVETETEVESSSSSNNAGGARVALGSKRAVTGVGFSQITDSSDHGVRIRYVGSQRIVTRVSTAAAPPISNNNSDESANANNEVSKNESDK